MWRTCEDTLTCRNTASTSRMMSLYIIILGLAILAAGIADVVTYATMCPTMNTMDYSAVAVGIWGSLPIIFTGALANFLVDNKAFTVKFLQLASLASGCLFAPAIVVISSIDAAMSPMTCGSINSYAISISLLSFGASAMIMLLFLTHRLYCSKPVDDGQNTQVTHARAQRVYAKKDEFMVTNVPQTAEFNNGSSTAIEGSSLPAHKIHVPIGLGQREQSWGYVPSHQMATSGQAAFNASPKQQLAMAQFQQLQGGGAYQGSGVVLNGAGYQAGGALQGGGGYQTGGGLQGGGGYQAGGGLQSGGALQSGDQNYYVTFLPGDKIVTNAYPQLYKMST